MFCKEKQDECSKVSQLLVFLNIWNRKSSSDIHHSFILHIVVKHLKHDSSSSILVILIKSADSTFEIQILVICSRNHVSQSDSSNSYSVFSFTFTCHPLPIADFFTDDYYQLFPTILDSFTGDTWSLFFDYCPWKYLELWQIYSLICIYRADVPFCLLKKYIFCILILLQLHVCISHLQTEPFEHLSEHLLG